MNKKEGLTRRDFLKTALIAAGRVAVGNIDMPEWVEEFDEPSIEELAKICTKVLSDIEVAEILQQPDLGTALGYTFSLLIDHGLDAEQYLIGRKFLQGTIEKVKKEEKKYAFPIEQLMISPEDRELIESTKIEPYPMSTLEVQAVNKSLSKLKIRTSLIPLSRLSHVKVEWLEFNSQMISELERSEQLKILATVLQWEKENGKNVKLDGAIGELKN